MKQYVSMSFAKPFKVPAPLNMVASFQPSGGKIKRWLMEKAWKFLNDNRALSEKTEYKRVDVVFSDLQDYLDKTWNLFNYINEYRFPTRILMGRPQFDEFLQASRQNLDDFGFYTTGKFDMTVAIGSRSGVSYRNLAVEVVPYMDGVLFV